MRRLFVLFALGLLTASCDDDLVDIPAAASPPPPSEIMPLAVGNTWWTTSIDRYSVPGETLTVSIRRQVVQDTVVNGETWYYLVIGDTTPRKIGHWAANRDDGYYGVDRRDASFTPFLQVLYPCRAGDRYPHGDDTVVVAATDAVIEVGGTEYTCQEHCLRTGQDSMVQYFVPGLGAVLSKIFLEVDSNQSEDIEELLDSAHIN